MEKHTFQEDIIAMITGSFLVAQGIMFLQAANAITGGTAGLALLLNHLTPYSFGVLYLLCNTPFYWLAWKRFGQRFALNSFISGLLVSLFTGLFSPLVQLTDTNPVYAAISGGLLMGLGMLILFRHRSSLGGFNVFCLFVQDKLGISVGKTQLCIDASIVCASFFYLPPETIAVSILSAAVLNVVLAMNHKPSRYCVTYGSS
ncbi:YitT family protein [Vibrio rhizosphaerae]|uniref:YitT family protein n=1 Tax=Vibrio rhizosphaerae TaxID=398736 RepID=A0ABU4IS92_9VIBR|nr:YitT family protein [Vibrio rhizosphaerae]MDW6092297.1 YitT family protein [Vibrio rhizosphaerae]